MRCSRLPAVPNARGAMNDGRRVAACGDRIPSCGRNRPCRRRRAQRRAPAVGRTCAGPPNPVPALAPLFKPRTKKSPACIRAAGPTHVSRDIMEETDSSYRCRRAAPTKHFCYRSARPRGRLPARRRISIERKVVFTAAARSLPCGFKPVLSRASHSRGAPLDCIRSTPVSYTHL